MDCCRFCGTGPLLPVPICPQCHKVLQDNADPSQSDLKNTPRAIDLLPDQPNSVSVTESLQQTLTQRQTELAELQQTLAQSGRRLHEQMGQYTSLYKQLEAYFQRLVQIQQDIRDQLEQLRAKEEDKVNDSPKKDDKKHSRFLWIFSILVIVAVLVFLADLTLIVLYSTPDHRSNFLDLSFTAIGVLGGIYLAYDLLDNKLLSRLAAYVTVALIGILGATVAIAWLIAQDIAAVSPLEVLKNLSTDPMTLAPAMPAFKYTSLASFCLLSGAFIGVYGNLLTKSFKSSRRSWRTAFLLELLFCFIFWAVLFAFFDLAMRVGETSSKLAEDAFEVSILGVPTAIVVRFYRILINRLSGDRPDGKTSHARDKPFLLDLLSWLSFWLALSAVGFVLYPMVDPKYRDNPLPVLGTYILSAIILAISSVLLIRFCRSIVGSERTTSSPWHKAFPLDLLSWLSLWVPLSASIELGRILSTSSITLAAGLYIILLTIVCSVVTVLAVYLLRSLYHYLLRPLYDRFLADFYRSIIITILLRNKVFLLDLLSWLGLWMLLFANIDLVMKIIYPILSATNWITLEDGLGIILLAIVCAALTVSGLKRFTHRLTAKDRKGRYSFGYWIIRILSTLLVFSFLYLLALSFLVDYSGNQDRLLIPIPTALFVGLGFALSGTLSVVLKKSIDEKIDHLGKKRNKHLFGLAGLVLVSLATILPKIPTLLGFFAK